jgi:hypothetical protein
MKYDALDAAILKAIKEDVETYWAISQRVEALARPHSLGKDWARVVDRRLQSLRKRGFIKFLRKHWYLVQC